MNRNNTSKDNRAFTSEELLSLLKELKVSKVNDEEFVQSLKKMDGKLGNSDNQQSMCELVLLLLKLDVDVWDKDNLKIIGNAVDNKKAIVSDKVNRKVLNLSFYKENMDIETYVRMIMLDLGLKPYLSGFELFKDAVLYLLSNDGNCLGWVRDVYPALGEMHGIKYFNVERALRTAIASASLEHYDNDVCRCVYGFRKKVTVVECICLVIDYIKFDLKKNNMLFDVNASNYCYYGGRDAIELKSNLISSSVYLKDEVSKLLNHLGIVSKIDGYWYLQDAILYVLTNDCVGNYLVFYDYLASLYGTNGKNVERSIRYAISKWRGQCSLITPEQLQSNEVPDVIKFIYKYEHDGITSEFISMVAEYIRLTVDKSVLEQYKKENQISILKKVKK